MRRHPARYPFRTVLDGKRVHALIKVNNAALTARLTPAIGQTIAVHALYV